MCIILRKHKIEKAAREDTVQTTTSVEQNDNLVIKSIRTTKASPAKKLTANADKPPTKRRT
ncbi:unnamed protein product, partial [Adineta steineri]